MNALSEFQNILRKNQMGSQAGVVSVCSGNSLVITAALRCAKAYKTFALIESTSNQVNQSGGYTGMTPDAFVSNVKAIAIKENMDADQIIFGGDHLGPNTWRHLSSQEAMKHASHLVAAYIKAGYKKIHLDASFICNGDTAPLSETLIAERSAQMAARCEKENRGVKPLYIIGTEVPIPGGAFEDDTLTPTPPESVGRVIPLFKQSFAEIGLSDAWERVVGIVVQPGMEYGNDTIHHYAPNGNPGLASEIENHKDFVYEAHSTDYQTRKALFRLVKDHFGILKVGPWLTFTLRESLYLLESIEKELHMPQPSYFKSHLLSSMYGDSCYWKNYHAKDENLKYQFMYSYFDRSRYYLGYPKVQSAIKQLFDNLSKGIPMPLLSQYLPIQYQRVCEGSLPNRPYDIVINRICDVLDIYMSALGYQKEIL